MSRFPVHVRGVRLEDAADLLDLWQLPSRPSTLRADALADVQAGIRKVLATDRERIVLAELDGDVAGALHLRVAPLAPLSTEQAVHVSHLHVAEEYRRRGIGRTLLETAVTWAEEHGVTHLVTMAAVNSRESSRFMARLGFSQAVTLRVAPTAALRARLPGDLHGVRPLAGGRQLAQVLAARRSQRRNQTVV